MAAARQLEMKVRATELAATMRTRFDGSGLKGEPEAIYFTASFTARGQLHAKCIVGEFTLASWGGSIFLLLFRFSKKEIQIRPHRGPLGGDDAIDAGVAQGAVGGEVMAAQDAVELCAQALNRAAAGVIEKMRAEFDGDAIE